jgi:lysophospholipid acyltransferase (LPLAT)-like uncharacterized protein
MRRFGEEARLDLKAWWREIRPELISGLLYHLCRLANASVRVTAVGFPEDSTKTIFCGWHGRSFVFANFFRNKGYWVIISTSRDGDIQTNVFTRFGYNVIRGSTTRGGARAALEAIRALKRGGTMAMTPDGPRGPSGVIQGGVMLMAQRAGAKLIPVGISAAPRYLVKSWDRYMVPVPFVARALLIAGDPITVAADADEAAVEQARLRLQEECHRLQREADDKMGVVTPPPPPQPSSPPPPSPEKPPRERRLWSRRRR